MVGLVIVSHSRALAVALQDLVRTVTNHADIPLAIAAGVGDERAEFGTDAVEIMEAIQSVYSPDGVVVLMDLGSAVLSAQMALDLLPPEMAAGVTCAARRLVEGSIAAAVQISLGADAADGVPGSHAWRWRPRRNSWAKPPRTGAAADASPPSG